MLRASPAGRYDDEPLTTVAPVIETSGVVHDLGNLIQIAASAVNIIARSSRAGHDAALEPVVARARVALARAGALVHQSTAPPTQAACSLRARPDLQNILDSLEEIGALISWICEPDIVLRLDAAADLPALRCSRIELQSAVLNLLINARDAMPEGGSITIRVHRASGGPLPTAVVLSVGDDGEGMTPETLQRAFNPHFTTKSGGRGAGLGLAMVRHFAEGLGGQAFINSSPGAGTTVTLWLPITSEDAS